MYSENVYITILSIESMKNNLFLFLSKLVIKVLAIVIPVLYDHRKIGKNIFFKIKITDIIKLKLKIAFKIHMILP